MPNTAQKIDELLRQELQAVKVEIQDLSDQHRGHPGASGGGGHYRARIVSQAFEGKSLVERHRMVYAALAGLMGGEIHALALKTETPEEGTRG